MDDVYWDDDLSDDADGIPNAQHLGQEEVLEDGQHIESR